MGDRGQVKITAEGNPDLYLYTHWGAESLPEVVANALARGRDRWTDDEYLNRIIFSEMIQGEVLEETGYGIGFGEHGDVWRVVEINYDDRTVAVREIFFEDFDLTLMDFAGGEKWVYSTEPMAYEMFIAEFATP